MTKTDSGEIKNILIKWGVEPHNSVLYEIEKLILKAKADQKAEDYREVRKELKRIAVKFAPDGEYPVGFWDEVWQLLDKGRGR